MAFDTQSATFGAQISPEDKAKSWQQQQEAFQTGMGALQNQIGTAQKTEDIWSQIQKANEAQAKRGMDALRMQAAETLYGSRGSLGGGGGLAAIQNQQAQTAYNIANATAKANEQRAQLAQQAQQAEMGAQEQIAQAAGTRYKMLQEQGQRQNRINQALDSARQIMQRHAGTIYTTMNDKKAAAKDIQREVLAAETDPAVIQAVQGYIQALTSGQENVKGTIDV